MEIGWITAVIAAAAAAFLFGNKNKKNDPAVNTTPTPDPVVIEPEVVTRKSIKKALLVGINKYVPELGADLQGCVNDVNNMYALLTNTFGFKPDNIRVLIDERATRQGIIDRLKWLLDKAMAGDELVFHYSGHGSQIRDRNGDELDDQLDEILCPHDMDWDNPLTDDILAEILKQLPKGVYFTMICDSCHSGTMTKNFGNPGCRLQLPRFIVPPFDIQCRTTGRHLNVNKIGMKGRGSDQNHILISGCRDNQTSADANIDGKYQGAFTWAFTESIKKDPNVTWLSIYTKVLDKLAAENFSQVPQLSGNSALRLRKIFGGVK